MLCGVVNAFLADPSLVEPGKLWEGVYCAPYLVIYLSLVADIPFSLGQYVTMGAYTAYPYSRGKIHITDKEDVLNGYTCSYSILISVCFSFFESSEPASFTGTGMINCTGAWLHSSWTFLQNRIKLILIWLQLTPASSIIHRIWRSSSGLTRCLARLQGASHTITES